ncbi:AMP-binding protein [soil metagenome]
MTYLDKLIGALSRDTGRVVLVDADSGTSVSASELTARIARLAQALRTTGIGAGSLVALVAPNTVDALAVRYAAGLLGCPTVYCPYQFDPDRLTAFLGAVDADLIIVFPETAAAVGAEPTTRTVSVGSVPGIAEDLLAGMDSEALPLPSAPVLPAELCALVASGGTTGVSKASRRDWQTYAAMVDSGAAPDRRQLVCTPLAYIAQMMADMALIAGGTVVLLRRFEPRRVLQAMQEYRVTHVTLVEPQLVALTDCDVLGTTDLSAVRAISHVGADCAPGLRIRLLERLGRPILVNTYGASEIGLVSVLAAPDYHLDHPELLASAGRPLAGIEVRIVDTDDNDCGPEELGSILVRSGAMAQGYSGSPTSSGFRVNGWFDTGDMGSLDAGGYLTIRGRRGDMRIIDGQRVFPKDIQDSVCLSPDVRYAVAVPDPAGAGFGVVVVPRPGAHPTGLPEPAVLVETVPMTEQGKPHRQAIVDLVWPAR